MHCTACSVLTARFKADIENSPVDYILILGRAERRSLPCAVCDARPAPHLLSAASRPPETSDRDRALCDVHAAGLQENSGVSEEDIERLRAGSAPESWQ